MSPEALERRRTIAAPGPRGAPQFSGFAKGSTNCGPAVAGKAHPGGRMLDAMRLQFTLLHPKRGWPQGLLRQRLALAWPRSTEPRARPRRGAVLAALALLPAWLGAWTAPAASAATLAPIEAAGEGQTGSPWQPVGLPQQSLPRTRYSPVQLDGQPALRLSADGSYGHLVHAWPAGQALSRLQWQWRLDQPNPAADLRQKAGDDNPVKVCVLFNAPLDSVPFVERQLLRLARARSGQDLPAATLCYLWTVACRPAACWTTPTAAACAASCCAAPTARRANGSASRWMWRPTHNACSATNGPACRQSRRCWWAPTPTIPVAAAWPTCGPCATDHLPPTDRRP